MSVGSAECDVLQMGEGGRVEAGTPWGGGEQEVTLALFTRIIFLRTFHNTYFSRRI